MIDTTIRSAVEMRITRAFIRYGNFASTHEALGVATEEWHELVEAIRSNDMASVRGEALDLAAVLIRLAEHTVYDGAFMNRSTKG